MLQAYGEVMSNKDKDQIFIPNDLYEQLKDSFQRNDKKLIDETFTLILKNQMFQMLNDFPIPHEYCLHLRQIVYPSVTKDGTTYKSYQCINCKKYL